MHPEWENDEKIVLDHVIKCTLLKADSRGRMSRALGQAAVSGFGSEGLGYSFTDRDVIHVPGMDQVQMD